VRAPNSSNPLHLVISAEDKADRLEACTALLPPEVAELDAQRGAVVATAKLVAQQEEVVVVAAAEPVAQQEEEVVVAAAAEPAAQQEAGVAAAELVAQQEAGVAAAGAAEPVAQQEGAAAAPGSRQAVAVTAARSALRSREPSVD
jgi:hypothetical protein